jgi:hypothetical protein
MNEIREYGLFDGREIFGDSLARSLSPERQLHDLDSASPSMEFGALA